MARQAERREATRGALIKAARSCFVDHGFEATSTEAVLVRAGVSKGALYHHFDSKLELLAAVFDAVTREVVAKAQQAAIGASSPREALSLALKAWLRAALAPEPRRIILETGPAVLGLARARLIEEEVTQVVLRRGINRILEDENAHCADIDVAARLLSALVAELALVALQRSLSGVKLERLDGDIDAVVNALINVRHSG